MKIVSFSGQIKWTETLRIVSLLSFLPRTVSSLMSLRCVSNKVVLQLDSPLSSAFAGVAVALERGLYAKRGLDLAILPTCAPGGEAASVLSRSRLSPGDLHVGVCAQRVLSRGIVDNLEPVTAVGAMMGRSPIALATLPSSVSGGGGAFSAMRVGAHTDTVELMQRLFPSTDVVKVSRGEKFGMLLKGELDAVQICSPVEEMELNRSTAAGSTPVMLPLSGLRNGDLGYDQVLFVSHAQLRNEEHASYN